MPRITPAHAGNTSYAAGQLAGVRDHPRSRGKHSLMSTMTRPLSGSPPLTRETHKYGSVPDQDVRITPAHAGNTLHNVKSYDRSRDHPRSRGKHNALCASILSCLGSPPLTRETLLNSAAEGADRGITPAHAGNTIMP